MHIGGKTIETVKQFDDKTWEKVKIVNVRLAVKSYCLKNIIQNTQSATAASTIETFLILACHYVL